ncbi:MAG: S9 family peptidase, partial [Deltaproteobacteria bacterium]|nr:S9 family peptidase [Deltaproteobacteria bacterium]
MTPCALTSTTPNVLHTLALAAFAVVAIVVLAACPGAGTAKTGKPAAPTPKAHLPIPAPEAPAASAPKAPAALTPPTRAARGTVVDTVHGVKIPDPYRWLEKLKDNPKTQRWLKAHNTYARAVLAKLPDRKALLSRLAELSYVEAISAPRRRGKRIFWSRRHKDKEKIVWYWRQDKKSQGKKGQEKVLIDPNTLSKDGSVSLTGVSISWDGRKIAYTLNKNGADASTLHVMDVATGKVSSIDVIPGAKYAHASWMPRARGFYYTRLPVDPKIPVADLPAEAAVYYHKLGTDPKKDKLVHPKIGDPRMFIEPDVSRDGRYLFIYKLYGWTKTDIYFKDLRHDKNFQKLAVGYNAKFSIVAHKGRFYMMTNYRAPNYRVFRLDPKKLATPRDWQEIVPEKKKAVLRDIDIVGGRLALRYLHNAYTELRVARLNGKHVRKVSLPGIGTASNLIGNPDSAEAYYHFSSFITPSTIYRVSVRHPEKSALYFKLNVPVDPSPFVVKQVFYPSKDGTKISMFIIERKDAKHDGKTPFRLYGYGGFDISITPSFRASHFVWLDSGGAMAFPNLRGGGEYGELWHKAGMREHKQNVFDDFIAAAEYLIKNNYTRKDRLAIVGGSNGGLLVGASMVQRPDLFHAVVCAVPLLDMVRYHLFGSGKTWIAEYGSAEDPKLFPAIYAYSPYQHIKKGVSYPSLLMLSADNDDRVDPMHARKFVAAIRWAQAAKQPILLRVETHSG